VSRRLEDSGRSGCRTRAASGALTAPFADTQRDASEDATRTRSLTWARRCRNDNGSGGYGTLLRPRQRDASEPHSHWSGRDRPPLRRVPSLRRKQTRLPDSERTEILERYLAGETANALAETHDVNPATLFAILQRAGISSRYQILTDLDVCAATMMYESGQSLSSIAKHFGVADQTVVNAFRRVGVPTRSLGTNQWSQRAASPTPR